MKTGSFQFYSSLVKSVIDEKLTLSQAKEILGDEYTKWFNRFYQPELKVYQAISASLRARTATQAYIAYFDVQMAILQYDGSVRDFEAGNRMLSSAKDPDEIKKINKLINKSRQKLTSAYEALSAVKAKALKEHPYEMYRLNKAFAGRDIVEAMGEGLEGLTKLNAEKNYYILAVILDIF